MRPKHRKLADRWIEHQNGQKAAVEAGYSPKYARQTAYKILQRPEVQAYIQEQLDKDIMGEREVRRRMGKMAREADSESVRLRALEDVAKIHKLMEGPVEGELTFRVKYGSDDSPASAPPEAKANSQ